MSDEQDYFRSHKPDLHDVKVGDYVIRPNKTKRLYTVEKLDGTFVSVFPWYGKGEPTAYVEAKNYVNRLMEKKRT